MNFQLDQPPPFIREWAARALERQAAGDLDRPVRRRIAPIYLGPVAPKTPPKREGRKAYTVNKDDYLNCATC